MAQLKDLDAFIDLIHSSEDIEIRYKYWIAQVALNVEPKTYTAPFLVTCSEKGLDEIVELFRFCQQNVNNKLNCVKFINNPKGSKPTENFFSDMTGLKESKDLFDNTINPLLVKEDA